MPVSYSFVSEKHNNTEIIISWSKISQINFKNIQSLGYIKSGELLP